MSRRGADMVLVAVCNERQLGGVKVHSIPSLHISTPGVGGWVATGVRVGAVGRVGCNGRAVVRHAGGWASVCGLRDTVNAKVELWQLLSAEHRL